MAPSFSKLATAAALVSGALATGTKSYQLTEHYNATNFFDKFEFFVSDFDGYSQTNHMAIDPTHGFVDYLSKDDALDAGLITAPGQDIAIRVDSENNYVRGRASVRLESHTRYNDGLIIAHFTHFPKPVCGAWPAFWMYGPDWPRGGELDIYEKWNLSPTSSITAHTGKPSEVGVCTLDESLSPATSNCWVDAPGQWSNEGCSVTETNGQWGNPDGGVYAVEWTETALKVWSWPVNNIPQDIVDGTPDPSTWQNPHFFLNENTCDVDRAFKDMRLVIDITFCGDAAGNEGLWGNSVEDTSKCSGITGQTWCPTYVNYHASEYKDVYWEVEDIKHYRLQQNSQPSSSSAVPSSTIYPSSSVASSSTVPSSSAASSVIPSSSAVPSSSIIPSSSAASSVVPSSSIVPSSSAPSSAVSSGSVAPSSSVTPSSSAASSAASSLVPSSSAASSIISSSAIPSSSAASSAVSSSAISSSAVPSSSEAPAPSGSVYPVPSDSSSSTCTTSTTTEDKYPATSSSTSCSTTSTGTEKSYPAVSTSTSTSCTTTSSVTSVPYPWISKNSTFTSHYYPATTSSTTKKNCYSTTAPNGAVYTITYGSGEDEYKPTAKSDEAYPTGGGGADTYPPAPPPPPGSYESAKPVSPPIYPPVGSVAPVPYPPAPYPGKVEAVKSYPYNEGPAQTTGEYAAVAPTGGSEAVTVSGGVRSTGVAGVVAAVAGLVGFAGLML